MRGDEDNVGLKAEKVGLKGPDLSKRE